MRQRDGRKKKKRGVSMERSKAGTKERSPDGLPHPNYLIIIILSCLTSFYSSKIIQKTISVNHEGLSTPITT